MATERIDILVSAKDQASSTLSTIDKELEEIDDSGTRAGKSLGTVGVALGSFAGGLALQGVSAAGGAMVDFAQDSFQAVQDHEDATLAWGNATQKIGADADSALESMKTLSQGTLDEAKIMQLGAAAIELGAADSVESLEDLFKIAQSRASLGGGIDKAFEDVVTGVGRQSLMILDNLGISSADMAEGMEDYAASIGTTVDELDDVAKKQAFFTAVQKVALPTQEEFQKSFETTSTAVAQYKAAMVDAKAAFGELFGPAAAAMLSAAASSMQDVLLGMDDADAGLIKQYTEEAERLQSTIAEMEENQRGGIAGFFDKGAGGVEQYQLQLDATQEKLDALLAKQAEANALIAPPIEELTPPEDLAPIAEPELSLDETTMADEIIAIAEEVAKDLESEIESAGIGANIVDTIADEMQEQSDALMAAGSASANDFIDGFMDRIDSLPGAIIDAIINQVTGGGDGDNDGGEDGGRTGSE